MYFEISQNGIVCGGSFANAHKIRFLFHTYQIPYFFLYTHFSKLLCLINKSLHQILFQHTIIPPIKLVLSIIILHFIGCSIYLINLNSSSSSFSFFPFNKIHFNFTVAFQVLTSHGHFTNVFGVDFF